MTTYGTDLDFGAALAAPSRCPDCGSHGLRPVCHDDQAVFVCPSCGQRWRIELGRVTRVEPTAGPTVTPN